ncbi:hypothetical protein MATL_G00083660 [Megalops atlanticus]|uniref:PDZ and pleckstrin homology domains 1 n=1 Tax=Megalops atlanticus TaxID=7932 RepID=A0A9D3Q3A8_MEGAT|nr:hypothetical protein MATL_G00083660 [Megalops atlanticus]
MSKRRRRNSRRRKSSSCTKHSHSPYAFQPQSHSPINSVAYENDSTEKGETDSLRRENFSLESEDEEDKEAETLGKQKRFRRDSGEEPFKANRQESTVSELGGTDKGMRITTSVTIDDQEVSSSQIVFQRSHEPEEGNRANGSVSVTTTKVKCIGSNVKVEIKEVMRLENSDICTTVVVQNRKEKNKEACLKSRWDTQATPNNEKVSRSCSMNHNMNYTPYSKCESKNYRFSVSEINTDFNEIAKSPARCKSHEERDCRKSCCEDRFYSHRPSSHRDTEEFCDSLSTLSDTCPQGMEQLLPNAISKEVLSDIPPPQEFADKEYDLVEKLTEDIGSCKISPCDMYEQQGELASSLPLPEDTRYNPDYRYKYSLEGENHATGTTFLGSLSESDTYDSLVLGPNMPLSRSSFTKEFVHSHDGTRRLRNNSIAVVEAKPRRPVHFNKQTKRRRTFPGPIDYSDKMPEGLSSCRESFSSGTLSPFFMQSLSLQAERVNRFYMDDESPFSLSAESRKSSESSNGYRPMSTSCGGNRAFLSSISAYGNIRNPFYPFKTEEGREEAFYGHYVEQRNTANEEAVAADQGIYVVQTEQSEVAESGFDEEMVETDEQHPEVSSGELTRQDLLIHVTPPSPSNSEELINESSPTCQLMEGMVIPKMHPQETAGDDTPPKKRRGSVMTIIIGGSEQRLIQNDSKPIEVMVPEMCQSNTFRTVCDMPSVSLILDMDETEINSNSDMFDETKSTPQRSLTDELSTSVQSFAMSDVSREPTEMRAENQSPSQEPKDGGEGNKEEDSVPTEDGVTAGTRRSSSNAGSQDSGTTDSKPRLQQSDSSERSSIPKSPTDVKLEDKEHLRPPADPILKDQEDARDRWAKRRKLFKESKQWSSTGGSSLTSNITEESVNSEDGRSVDMTVRDIEERGFYTETFHSASWIYRGDDVNPSESPRCLSNRPRPVTIRERTVKINKGIGDYPWGFRIQFSKPIVVTEVDTNGAAEEAGLQVGDYVLTVNGTDVTSVPHSEAADLARQGPDVLTLIIGSDISRCPNTPRPACRGYLHKRTQSGLIKGWRKRWFVLKHDCCLYYYRHKRDEGKHHALAAMKLEGAEVGPDTSLGKPFVFKCSPVSGSRVYYFCATSNQEMKRWLEAMERAVHPTTQTHVWIDVTRHNANLPPLAIKNPECLGLLHQMDKHKDVWVQQYCILKDGCLYFYAGIRSTHAMGGIFLHGYTVKEQPYGSKRSTIELKPPSDEFKTFHLCAENATENKRWILAIKASIAKWLPLHQAIEDFMNRPAEETRM